ncbi:MAG: arylsulfatase [Planctomycetota bacterium]
MRSLLLPSILVASFAACAAPREVEPAGAPARPNLVVIYADDMGYGDCGALNPDARFATPHLDRLAGESMVFLDAHSTGSVCTPSRYGLLTGQYAWRTGRGGVVGADADALIAADRVTLPRLLQDVGYRTAVIGKWHLGMQIPGTKGDRDWSVPVLDGPTSRGFDVFYGIPASMNFGVLTWYDGDRATAPASKWTRKKFPPSEIETGPKAYRMAPPYDDERQGKGDVEVAPGFVDEEALGIIADKAEEFLAAHAADSPGEPFFLYVPLTSPHLPHCAAEEFRGTSAMGAYGDFMRETDHRVGQVLVALEQHGLAENTIVVFSSDNGPERNYSDWERRYGHRCAGPFRGGKRDLYEGGHRVPFFVRWPGVVAPGSTCDEPVSQADLLATLADVLDVELPRDSGEDSFSLVPALRGDALDAPLRGPIVHHGGGKKYALRDGRWKLILAPRLELYDLDADPGETTDLAEQRPEVVERLRRAAERLMEGDRSRD